MLTRYRELYNRLTHSKAFKPEGSMNNELVNKKTFTPHNLKSIIIGANGYVAVRFTTYSKESNLVYVDYFTEGYKNDVDYINGLKEEKGMIDALVDGYKFNYLEEILICVNGFTPDELNKEMNRVNNFILKHANTFKRLSGIYQVNAVINDNYKQLKSNSSISKQLSSVVPITPMFQQKVERTELGLLVRPGLHSDKYEMDSEYKEDLPDTEKGKEKYRLSKYFYDEIKKVEQERKNKTEELNRQKKEQEEQQKKEAEKQKLEELKQKVSMFAAQEINVFVRNNVATLESLYKSGFSGFPQVGILVFNNDSNSSPIIRFNPKRNSVVSKAVDEGTVSDNKILETISSVYPNYKNQYVANDRVIPSFEDMRKVDGFVLWQLHLMFQSADMQLAKGNNTYSIRKFISETTQYKNAEEWREKENGGSYKLKKWEMVKKWYEWTLRNIIINALLEFGVTGSNNGDTEKVIEVCNVLSNHIKNIIVVSQRDKLVNMEIRISSGSELNSEILIQSLKAKLNEGFESGQEIVGVSERSKNTNNVKILNIIFDKEAENKTTLFAGDMVDEFINSNIVPTWDKAILGKNEDGTPLIWDRFMNPSENTRCYTIYAASGSGKGTMTSTLIASALCDNREVFYTDGKPENGPVMGRLAWKQKKEAYVFDGKARGSEPFSGLMENYTNGMRTENEVETFYRHLPSKLFNDKYFPNNKKRMFMGLMRYLKSMDFCFKVVDARNAGELPMENWQIWIFDELTSMSNVELQIRDIFRKYCEDKQIPFKASNSEGYTPIASLGKVESELLNKSSLKYDEGLDYINRWLEFCKTLQSNALNASVISLRKANANMFFIFQEPSWLAEKRHGRFTTIGNIVSNLSSLKIVGKGGIVKGADVYGDGTMGREEWVQKLKSGKGYWAISEGVDIRSSNIKLFKPFNIYTVPNQRNANDETVPMGRKDTDYFEGYLNKLTASIGINPADVIESAYLYADSAVKQLGLSNGIKDYIYDCTLSNGNSLNAVGVGVGADSDEDDRYSNTVNMFEGKYIAIINEIRRDRNGLDTIKRKEGNEAKFNNKKDELLHNFDGKYKIKQDAFFADISKVVLDEDLRKQVVGAYKNRFMTDFESLKSEIASQEFVVGDQPQGRQADDYDADSNIFDYSSYTPQNNQDRPHRQNQPNNTPSSTTPQPQRQQGSSTQPITSQPQNNTQQQARQNDRNTVSDRNYYRGRIEVNDNPFTKYTNNTNIDTMLTVKDMTKILMDDIRKNVCPDEMITSFMIADGTLFINEIIYEPSFDNAFMNSLPQSLRIKVENGQMAEFFDLRRIYHYKNLEKFGLMDETLAQGRARKEMGIGFRKRWSVLFKKFKRLQLIQVGQIKYFRENPDTNEEQGFLDRFKNNPATTYSSGIGSGFMDKVWDSRPVRVLTGAMGWTVGVQATWFLASIMGPWGLLFGAFAMAGAMKEIKNSRNNNYSNNQANYQSQSYNQQYQGKTKTTQKKKNNKTNWND